MLQTPALEYCQNQNLRGRKFSLNRPQELLQQVRTGLSGSSLRGQDNDVAVDDDVESLDDVRTSPQRRAYSTSVPLRTLPGAHVSGNATTVSLPRYRETVLEKLDVPVTPASELSQESSYPTSPKATSFQESSPSTEKVKIRIATSLFVYFIFGWAEGLTATVLPYFKADFNLTYMTSSLLFVGTTVGVFGGTFIVESLLTLLGLFRPDRTKVSFFPAIMLLGKPTAGHSPSQAMYLNLVVCSFVHASNFIMMGSRESFPVLIGAYVLAALARALVQASLNPYLNATPYPGALALACAMWSFGGVVSPLICQSLITAGISWGYFYYGSLALSAINACLTFYAFRPTKGELKQERRSNSFRAGSSPSSTTASKTELSAIAQSEGPKNTLGLALKTPYQWAFSLFMFLYFGSETSTQGFMVTYLLGTRNPPRSIGYVTSGFWAGHTTGRLLWAYFVKRLTFRQKKNIVFICMGFAVVMELLIMLVKSYLQNAVSASLIGLVYGPIWPAGIGLAAEVLSGEIIMVSMALMAAFASLGASILPFMTGTIANVYGVEKIGYVNFAQAAVALILWWFFPSSRPVDGRAISRR